MAVGAFENNPFQLAAVERQTKDRRDALWL
jgi:hypothetical protein